MMSFVSTSNNWRNDRTGNSGKIFEHDILFPQDDPRAQEQSKIAYEDVDYQSYRKAILNLIQDSMYSSTEQWFPPTRWLADVHAHLGNKLHLKNLENLKIHPASGTSADYHHGIDMIVEYKDPITNNTYVLTIDLTKNHHKPEAKADVVVGEFGAISNSERYSDYTCNFPDIDYADKDEEYSRNQQRREGVADVLAKTLQEKITSDEIFIEQQHTRQEYHRLVDRSF